MDYEKIKVGRAEDLTGQRFGNWTVLYRTTNSSSNKVRWVCQCDCEQQTIRPVEAKSLKSNTSTNCGCQRNVKISEQKDKQIRQRDENGNIVLKKCFRCGEWLSIENFWKNSSQKDGYTNECKICCSSAKENRYNIYKKNATRRNIDFGLSKEEFYKITSEPCHYCGNIEKYNGIDRIDSNQGYILNNCVPCCEYCNKMKLDYSTKFWIEHMKKIVNFYGDKYE